VTAGEPCLKSQLAAQFEPGHHDKATDALHGVVDKTETVSESSIRRVLDAAAYTLRHTPMRRLPTIQSKPDND